MLLNVPIPPETTKHISIDQKEWKVLYYYNDKDDEMVELPFYEFDINIPTSSQYTIDSIQVFIDNGKKGSILLGKYHPADIISVVDFLGYYEARKMVTKATNFQKAFEQIIHMFVNIFIFTIFYYTFWI